MSDDLENQDQFERRESQNSSMQRFDIEKSRDSSLLAEETPLPVPSKTLLVIACCVLFSSLILDFAATEELQDANGKIAAALQKAEALKIFWQIISFTVSPFVFAGLLLFSLAMRPMADSAKIIIVISLAEAMNCLLKIWYQRPRPYFNQSDVEPWGQCTTTLGMPSGHAMVGILIVVYTPLVLFHRSLVRADNVPLEKAVYSLLSLIYGGVCFSRVYLGMHTFMQILIGASLGFIVLYALLHYDETINNFIVGKTPSGYRSEIWKRLLVFTLMWLLLLLTYVGFENWKPPRDWVTEVYQKCDHLRSALHQEEFRPLFIHQQFAESAVIWFAFGITFGTNYTWNYSGLPTNWNSGNFFTKLMLLLGATACWVGILAVFILAYQASDVVNTWTAYFFYSFFTFSSGFFLYGVYPSLVYQVLDVIRQT